MPAYVEEFYLPTFWHFLVLACLVIPTQNIQKKNLIKMLRCIKLNKIIKIVPYKSFKRLNFTALREKSCSNDVMIRMLMQIPEVIENLCLIIILGSEVDKYQGASL